MHILTGRDMPTKQTRDPFPSRFSSDEKFWEAFARLNALNGEFCGWEVTKAQKPHLDLYDAPIRPGESYSKKRYGRAFDSYMKLSRESMDKLLFCVIATSPLARTISDKLIAADHQKLQVAMGNRLPTTTAPVRQIAGP